MSQTQRTERKTGPGQSNPVMVTLMAPQAALEAESQRTRLLEAVQQLPPEHRAVLLLYYSQELPSKEVAAALGCTDQQVRSRLSYARRKLREILEADHDAP